MRLVSVIKGVTIERATLDGLARTVQRICCASCGATEDFANAKGAVYPEEALFKFARQHGWEPSRKGKHVCPKCKDRNTMAKVETPREMTPKERRRIFREIDDCYEETASRYVDNITDDSIARKLGVPRKWVEDIRCENFGPAGENSEMQRVAAAIGRISGELNEAVDAALKAAERADKLKSEVEDLRADMDRIRKAVGPQRVA